MPARQTKSQKTAETTPAPTAPVEAREARPTPKEDVIAAIKNMTVLELADLVKALEAEFGVRAAAPVTASVPVAAGPVPAGPPVEEQTEFSVILTDFGANKINVIKVVREITALGLKEAKDLVEGAPKPVKESVTKAEAEAIKAKLVEAGAKAEIK